MRFRDVLLKKRQRIYKNLKLPSKTKFKPYLSELLEIYSKPKSPKKFKKEKKVRILAQKMTIWMKRHLMLKFSQMKKR